MTDYDLMLEQLDAIHSSAADLAALSAALRVTLSKLTRPTEDHTEASHSYMWGMPIRTQ
jgi:hypothetical protein